MKAKEATDEKVVKKAPAKKDTTKEKKIVSKAKVKAEKEDIAEVVAEVKEEKKTTKKATTKTAKEKAASDEKEPKKTTAKEKTSTSKKKVEEDVSEVEVKEEEATVVVSNNDATEEADEAKVEPVEESKKTKENNAKLEASIAKLKGKKVAEKSEAKDSKPDTDLDEGEEIIIDAPKTDSESQKRKEKIEEQAELLEKKKKRKSSIITTSIIAALIVIIVIIIIIIIGSLNSTTVESHDFYQWYSGQRVEYKGELTFTRKEGLTELKATDRKVTLDSTPVYYADENGKVIFPEDMAVVYPNNNGMMYRINHFADITEENGEIYLETNLATKTNKTKLEKAFLYDGQDLYFFLERTNITVNGTTYEVSPLSYAIVRYKQSVEIYNYEKDEYQVIDTTETQDAKVVTDTYTINMSVDSLQTAEKEQLLIKGLSYLQPFGEEAEK